MASNRQPLPFGLTTIRSTPHFLNACRVVAGSSTPKPTGGPNGATRPAIASQSISGSFPSSSSPRIVSSSPCRAFEELPPTADLGSAGSLYPDHEERDPDHGAIKPGKPKTNRVPRQSDAVGADDAMHKKDRKRGSSQQLL